MLTAVASVKRHLGCMGDWLACNAKNAEGWSLNCGMVSQMEDVLYRTRAVHPSSPAIPHLDRARVDLHHLGASMRMQRIERAEALIAKILGHLDAISV